MSDARLREYERRWRTSGDAEDLEAYARELERTGEGEEAWLLRVDHGPDEESLKGLLRQRVLTPERLRLGAWLGHEAARRLAAVRADTRDKPVRDVTDPRTTITVWWRAIQREFSSEFTDHVLVELSRRLLPIYEATRSNKTKLPFDDRLGKAVDAAARRLEEGPWESRDQVLAAARAAKQAEWDARGVARAEQVAGVVLCTTGALGGGPAPGEGRSWDGQPYFAPWRKTIVLLSELFPPQQLVRGLRVCLLPWALAQAPYEEPSGKQEPQDPW